MRRQTAISVLMTLLVAAGFWAGPSFAQDGTTGDCSGLNPNAPPETAQFAFLIGEWDAAIFQRSPAGEIQSATAIWRIFWILNGYAIQDTWIVYPAYGGEPNYGTMFRTYDAELGHWVIVEQTTLELEFKQMTAEQVGDTMVMTGEEETPRGRVLTRRVLHNIREDSFDWRFDLSYDGGETWEEGLYTMRVTRRR